MNDLLVASRNTGKLREIAEMLGPFGIRVMGLNERPHVPDVIEDGLTFLENARKKAYDVFAVIRCPVLADDSGLEVDALDGAPGVQSARYAGSHGDDDKNNAKLLAELQACGAVTPDERTARFRCVMVYFDGIDEVVTTGAMEGRIGTTPRGTNGFGYDPLFLVEGRDCTAAELAPSDKNRISHRGAALRAMREALIRKGKLVCPTTIR